jgi:hypothetical protein
VRPAEQGECIGQFDRQVTEEAFDFIQIVRLDGPADVAAQARRPLGSLLRYWEASQNTGERWKNSGSHSQDDNDRFMQIFHEFRDDITDFIAPASASLAE